jgi:hypothetical protein
MEKEFNQDDVIHDLLAASIVHTAYLKALHAAFLAYLKARDPEFYQTAQNFFDEQIPKIVEAELLKHAQFAEMISDAVQGLLKSVGRIDLS